MSIAAGLLLLLSFGTLFFRTSNQATAVQTNLASKQTDTNLKKQSRKNSNDDLQEEGAHLSRFQNPKKSGFQEQKLKQQGDNKHLATFKTPIYNSTRQATTNKNEKQN
jgi:hypothetical protein